MVLSNASKRSRQITSSSNYVVNRPVNKKSGLNQQIGKNTWSQVFYPVLRIAHVKNPPPTITSNLGNNYIVYKCMNETYPNSLKIGYYTKKSICITFNELLIKNNTYFYKENSPNILPCELNYDATINRMFLKFTSTATATSKDYTFKKTFTETQEFILRFEFYNDSTTYFAKLLGFETIKYFSTMKTNSSPTTNTIDTIIYAPNPPLLQEKLCCNNVISTI